MVATLDDLDEDALVDLMTKLKECIGQAIPAAVRDGGRPARAGRRGAAGDRAEGDRPQDRRARAALDHGGDPARLRCSSCRASPGSSEIVINREVVEGRAKPLHIYSDRRGDVGTGA